jgi:hypothetical protein
MENSLHLGYEGEHPIENYFRTFDPSECYIPLIVYVTSLLPNIFNCRYNLNLCQISKYKKTATGAIPIKLGRLYYNSINNVNNLNETEVSSHIVSV